MAKKFPIFWAIILVVGIAWLLKEIGYLKINVPWLPVILIIFAIGGIVNRFSE